MSDNVEQRFETYLHTYIHTYMNATVTYVPTLQVFPRSNMKAELLDGAPPGLMAACHKSLMDPERELYAMVQTFFPPFCEAV